MDAHVIRFGVFQLDTASGELQKQGLKIRLPDQSFQILKLLLSRPGEVVTREELQRALWTGDTFVDFELGLNSAVRKLREALNDSAESPRFVETLPRRGYRFIGSLTAPTAIPAAAAREIEPDTAQVPPSADAAPVAASSWTGSRLSVLALGALATLVAVAAFAYQRGGFQALRAPAGEAPIRSIVVLPFENLTGDPAHDYLVDGVTELLTAHLAQVSDLAVTSRTTAREYNVTGKRLPDIGIDLGVDGVVEGAVMRSGGSVRVTAKLIRAATDRHVWTHTYDGDLAQLPAVQRQIAADVAAAAGRPAGQLARAHDSIDPRAYDLYLKGLAARGMGGYAGLRTAAEYFEQAVAIDPGFAEGHAALGLAEVQFLWGGPLSPREIIPKAEAATRRALELDEASPQAHRALGQILGLYYWRWDESLKALERAVQLQVDRAELAEPLSTALLRAGRLREALTAAERGRQLDPRSFNAQLGLGTTYRAIGEYDRALTEIHRALAMSPGHTRAHFQLGVTYVAMGRLDEAIPELERAARSPQSRNLRMEAYLAYAYAMAGRTREAREGLKHLESQRREQYVSSFGIALIHDALGNKEAALDALQRAHDERAVEFAQPAQYPPFRTIANEPRFQAVMDSVGLPR